jgi:signal transduction protein with GAF and PtsI domain
MLTRSTDTQIDKARRTVLDVVRYAQQVAGDERLRSDVSAALAHGSKATDQVRKDLQADGTYSRLAADKKLRKHLRAMIDDLDAASSRVRRKSHRLRNIVLVFAGVVAAALALPKVRPWLTRRTDDFGMSTTEPESMT